MEYLLIDSLPSFYSEATGVAETSTVNTEGFILINFDSPRFDVLSMDRCKNLENKSAKKSFLENGGINQQHLGTFLMIFGN